MKTCLFAGTFDPITNGHMYIINKCKQLYDKVYVVVGVNESKSPLFSVDERLILLKKLFLGDDKVVVDFNLGLTVSYIKSHNIDDYVRGIRNDCDMVYEKENEKLSKKYYPNLSVKYIMCDEKLSGISSTLIREKLKNSENISGLVPNEICEDICSLYKQK